MLRSGQSTDHCHIAWPVSIVVSIPSIIERNFTPRARRSSNSLSGRGLRPSRSSSRIVSVVPHCNVLKQRARKGSSKSRLMISRGRLGRTLGTGALSRHIGRLFWPCCSRPAKRATSLKQSLGPRAEFCSGRQRPRLPRPISERRLDLPSARGGRDGALLVWLGGSNRASTVQLIPCILPTVWEPRMGPFLKKYVTCRTRLFRAELRSAS
jgi:hypothetical protein